MTGHSLVDCRVRAWLVQEGAEVACYLAIVFEGADQITVRAAARPSVPSALRQVVGAAADPKKVAAAKLFTAYQKAANAVRAPFNATGAPVAKGGVARPPLSKAAATKVEALRAQLRKDLAAGGSGQRFRLDARPVVGSGKSGTDFTYWGPGVVGKGAKEELFSPGVIDPKDLARDLKKAGGKVVDAASVALPVAAVIFPALAPFAIAAQVKNLIDAGSTAVKLVSPAAKAVKAVSDVAKGNAAKAAAVVLSDPKKVATLVAKGVPADTVLKAATAMQGAAKLMASQVASANGKHNLSALTKKQALELFRKSDPKATAATVEKAFDRFLYLQVA